MDYLEVVRLHRVWRNLHRRCNIPDDRSFKNYGGRGITVSPEWSDFNTFAEWCLANGSKTGLDLDRVDNDGPYSPDNCRFVTRAENNRNKRNNLNISAWGETKSLTEWTEDSRFIGVDIRTLSRRIKSGWDPEEALSLPNAGRRQKKTCVKGHPQTESNVYRNTKGKRRCAPCARNQAKIQYNKNLKD